jgi:phospholipid/cholesterol/gamma-HCH transport system substrate-binding protein
MKRVFSLEIAVGIFMMLGFLCLGYLSIHLGDLELLGRGGYPVSARFANVGSLREGAPVVVAGVEVGRVERITLDNYEALVVLRLHAGLVLHEDSIASVKTRGLIGEKYVQISAGASEVVISAGGRIRDTESALDFEELISKYAFGRI